MPAQAGQTALSGSQIKPPALPEVDDLGAPYQEDLRRYPLGETEFPSNGRLIVSVSSETEMTDVALTPRKINDRHEFYFFGLLFTLVFDK